APRQRHLLVARIESPYGGAKMSGTSPVPATLAVLTLAAALASRLPDMEPLPTGLESSGALLGKSANGFTLEVAPATLTLSGPGASAVLVAKVRNRGGNEVPGWRPE